MYLYLITNTVNGKQYVGITSRQVSKRFVEHLQKAKNGKALISKALNKYGREAFTMRVIGEASNWAALCQAEQDAIVAYNTLHPAGYNITAGGDGALGRKHTDEAKQRMREANTGRVMSQEFREAVGARMRGVPKSPAQRAKMSDAQRGERNHQFGKTPAHHAKMLEAIAAVRLERGDPRKGRPLSATHKARLSQAGTGKKQPASQIEARRAKLMGHPVSEETRAKLRAAALAQFARQGNPMQGKTLSEDTKQRISAAMKGKALGRVPWNKGRGAAAPRQMSAGETPHPNSHAVVYEGQSYVSVTDCARQVGVSAKTIRLYLRQGKARYLKDE